MLKTIAGLALAALIVAPSVAGAQMSSPQPMASGMAKSSMSGSSMKTSKAGKALVKQTKMSTHPKKAGEAQSTTPGSPTYSGSSGTGK